MPLKIGTQIDISNGATDWINAKLPDNDLLSLPIIVQFWAVSCPVCKFNLPRLQQLVGLYASVGLQLISVHMPRMGSDMDVEKVKAAVEELGLTGPCAIDNQHILGDRFETGGVWPCYFLFDAEGKLRSRAAGALGLKMAENSLKRMLGTLDGETAGTGEAR